MKKITLLMALLMWSSSFYGQTYLDEDFEGSFLPAGWVDQDGANDYSNITYGATSLVNGVTYVIVTTGTTDFTLIGAANNNPGTVFTMDNNNGANPGTGTGTAIGNENFWAFSTFRANSGTRSAFFNDFNGDNDKWLITSVTNLSGATSPELTYYENQNNSIDFGGVTRVYYSTDYSGDPDTATWTALNTTLGTDAEDNWKIRGPYALPTNATVYVAFRYTGNNKHDWYLDDVKIRETPSCVEPSAGSFSNVNPTEATFNWTMGPGGSETAWDIELVDITGGDAGVDDSFDGTPTVANTSTKPYTFTSLVIANTYHAYVRAKCGGSDSAWAGPYAFTTGISNDECVDAEQVSYDDQTNDASSATPISGTVDGATGTGQSNCVYNSDVTNDVWYTFVARTPTVNITTTGNFDGILELFSTTDNTCGTLSANPIFCSDGTDSGSNLEEINATGLSFGQRYYFRIYGYVNPSSRAVQDFTLKVWTPDTEPPLSVDNLVKNEFQFYPNPVQDKLKLRAQDNIENVSVYNMLGQEVMRQAPRSNFTEVNMSALQTGSYFVKVTINGTTETKQIIKR